MGCDGPILGRWVSLLPLISHPPHTTHITDTNHSISGLWIFLGLGKPWTMVTLWTIGKSKVISDLAPSTTPIPTLPAGFGGGERLASGSCCVFGACE